MPSLPWWLLCTGLSFNDQTHEHWLYIMYEPGFINNQIMGLKAKYVFLYSQRGLFVLMDHLNAIDSLLVIFDWALIERLSSWWSISCRRELYATLRELIHYSLYSSCLTEFQDTDFVLTTRKDWIQKLKMMRQRQFWFMWLDISHIIKWDLLSGFKCLTWQRISGITVSSFVLLHFRCKSFSCGNRYFSSCFTDHRSKQGCAPSMVALGCREWHTSRPSSRGRQGRSLHSCFCFQWEPNLPKPRCVLYWGAPRGACWYGPFSACNSTVSQQSCPTFHLWQWGACYCAYRHSGCWPHKDELKAEGGTTC